MDIDLIFRIALAIVAIGLCVKVVKKIVRKDKILL